MQVEEAVNKAIKEVMGEDAVFTNESTFDSINADEIDKVEITLWLEDELDIEFEEDAIDNLDTVQSMIDYVINISV